MSIAKDVIACDILMGEMDTGELPGYECELMGAAWRSAG